MRKVTLHTFEDSGCWWAKLIQHGRPVPEGARPNLAQSLCWSGGTREEAIAKAKDFIVRAVEVVVLA